ncbi:MAG: hypothetical protein Q9217_005335, partial [Psora testacea]
NPHYSSKRHPSKLLRKMDVEGLNLSLIPILGVDSSPEPYRHPDLPPQPNLQLIEAMHIELDRATQDEALIVQSLWTRWCKVFELKFVRLVNRISLEVTNVSRNDVLDTVKMLEAFPMKPRVIGDEWTEQLEEEYGYIWGLKIYFEWWMWADRVKAMYEKIASRVEKRISMSVYSGQWEEVGGEDFGMARLSLSSWEDRSEVQLREAIRELLPKAVQMVDEDDGIDVEDLVCAYSRRMTISETVGGSLGKSSAGERCDPDMSTCGCDIVPCIMRDC